MHILTLSTYQVYCALLALASVFSACLGFLVLTTFFHAQLPFPVIPAIVVSSVVVVGIAFLLFRISRRANQTATGGSLAIAALSVAGLVMALVSAYQLAHYVSLPVDLLSFSESPFVNDIIKLRLGTPIYTDPLDNNSYPYNPGSQILTYLVSLALGHGDSIQFYRGVQLSYVVLAAVVAVSVCHLLARQFLSNDEYRHRPLWMLAWLPLLFLVAIDHRFNLYNHSLHNDGLALLISVSAFWLITRYSLAPRTWLLTLMVILPSLGFLVKQNQLMWLGIFSVYFLVAGTLSKRQFALFLAASVAMVLATIGAGYAVFGDNYLYWAFQALGAKEVSLLRSIQHLFDASIYVMMGLFGGWILVLRNWSRTPGALWVAWLLAMGIAVYTSGVGFQANHLGPGVILAACWFFVALLKVWPVAGNAPSAWQNRAQEMVAVGMVVLVFGALGFVKEVRNPVPKDFSRYVSAIERQFEGVPAERLLMDTGSWVYLKEGVLMKDRSAPVSLHAGINQPEINRAMLRATINRIEHKTYDKILARQIDTDNTWYDFQDRGTGIKDTILENYHEVDRIPGVEGIEDWWPKHLVSEIVVLAPNEPEDNGVALCSATPKVTARCGLSNEIP